MSADAFVKTCIAPDGTTCLCGDNECSGLTAAFSILKDARQRFIDISTIDVRQKQAYLRHVKQRNRGSNYLALHHFHPVILWEDSHCIPKTLSLGKAVEMRMQMRGKDKLTLANGMPALFYCPNYPKSLVRQDLENLNPQTRIPETASVVEEEDTTNKKKTFVEILDIPKQVAMEEDESSEVSSIELFLEEKKGIITFLELVEAVIVCQNFVRLHQAKDALEQKRRERDARLVLQSSVRGWCVRSEMAREKRAAILIQTWWRVLVARTLYRRQYKSALLLQKLVRRLYQQNVASAIVVQRLVRGHAARQMIRQGIPNAAALKIQTAWRRYWTRRDYLLYLRDVITVQSLVRQQNAAAKAEMRLLAVLMVQTNVRRWLAFHHFQQHKHASIAIQTMWRQHAAYNAYRKKPSSAILIQRSCRGHLVRSKVHTQVTSAALIQRMWRCSWPQIQRNRELTVIVIKIQALVRGVLCRSKLGWIRTFIKLQVSEMARRKLYQGMFDNACTTWNHCLSVLESGVQEIACAERLVAGASMANQALASSLRSIAFDCFLDDDYSVISNDVQREQFHRQRQPHEKMPSDPVLTSLLKADAKMASKFDDVSGCGIGDVGPELALFRKEFELEVEEVKRIGKAVIKLIPTAEMKTTEKATQSAWDQLQVTVRSKWFGGDSTSDESDLSSLELSRAKKEVITQREVDMLVPFPAREAESFEASPLAFPKIIAPPDVNAPRGPCDGKASPPLGHASTPSPPTLPMTPEREAGLHSDVYSPQSVITADIDLAAKSTSGHDVGLTRHSSEYTWKDGVPMSPSSRRSFFGRQQSEGCSSFDRDLTADDCISILNEELNQMHGKDFFGYLYEVLLMPKDNESPELQLLEPSPSSGTPIVEDRWLLEVNYLAAATRQVRVWNACMGLLAKMSDAVKDIEIERCTKLNSMLLVALPLERRMLMEMKEVHETVVSEFLGIRHDREYLSESIESMIELHARLLRHRDNDHKSSILNRSRQLALDLTDTTEPLEPEATYGITHQAIVVERSVGLRAWKTTLAAVTIDRYMHLFDVSSHPEITIDSSTSEAFDMLLPDEDFHSGIPVIPREEKLLKHLDPMCSVDLRNCSISSKGDDTIDVTERCAGLFGRKVARRFVLRGEPEDLASWKHFVTRDVS